MSSAAQPFCRRCTDYSALIVAIRDRCDEMALARLELDRVAGLASGHAGKLLSKRPVKYLGLTSLGVVLQGLGLILLVVEDPVARDRTLARRTPVDVSNQRPGNSCNPKKSVSDCALPAPAVESTRPAKVDIAPRKPAPISRAHLRVVQSKPRSRFG